MEDFMLEYRILAAVGSNKGSMTQRDISQKIRSSVSSVNFALRLLAVKGFIKISGANPRRLQYHLTPKGILEKSVLAYNFMKKQIALYEEARNSVLGDLNDLKSEGIMRVAVYGWTPFTEAALLYLISEGIHVTAIYVDSPTGITNCNRIPVCPIADFAQDCDVLVLLEPLAEGHEELVKLRRVVCYPDA